MGSVAPTSINSSSQQQPSPQPSKVVHAQVYYEKPEKNVIISQNQLTQAEDTRQKQLQDYYLFLIQKQVLKPEQINACKATSGDDEQEMQACIRHWVNYETDKNKK